MGDQNNDGFYFGILHYVFYFITCGMSNLSGNSTKDLVICSNYKCITIKKNYMYTPIKTDNFLFPSRLIHSGHTFSITNYLHNSQMLFMYISAVRCIENFGAP